jgi:hypothetical protein
MLCYGCRSVHKNVTMYFELAMLGSDQTLGKRADALVSMNALTAVAGQRLQQHCAAAGMCNLHVFLDAAILHSRASRPVLPVVAGGCLQQLRADACSSRAQIRAPAWRHWCQRPQAWPAHVHTQASNNRLTVR